ncbi:MAG: hypothetical protein DI589_22390 [Shinella sp.]|nr:MAG: hypothetical protein DI589_22390 [Shinella sp.]
MALLLTTPGDTAIISFLAALRRAGGSIPLVRTQDKAAAYLAARLGYVRVPEDRPIARLTGLGQAVLDREARR